MITFWDILRRTFFICIFVIPVPLGAYTIHTGSSAMTALITYGLLSLCIPFFYLSSAKSGFGPEKKRANRWLYIIGWGISHGLTYTMAPSLNLGFLWSMPTVGRDVMFLLIMYIQVLIALLISYVFSRLLLKEGPNT